MPDTVKHAVDEQLTVDIMKILYLNWNKTWAASFTAKNLNDYVPSCK